MSSNAPEWPESEPAIAPDRVPTGVPGFDPVLLGGYPKGTTLLVQGAPGTGKTTLALQFLLEGARRGDKALFYSIAQSPAELERIAASHGMDLDSIEIAYPTFDERQIPRTYSVDSHEVQLVELIDEVHRLIEEKQPDLFVFDSLLEVRLLAPSSLQYRRELLNLRQRLRLASVTCLLLDHFEPAGERHAEGIVHGVVQLDAETPPVGNVNRRLSIQKLRGSPFRGGFHDFRIRTGGVAVFPRVRLLDWQEGSVKDQLRPPHQPLAEMLHGGLEFGTTTLIAGQAGAGKSTLSTLFACAAADEGKNAALFLFEERPEIYRVRSAALGMDLAPREKAETLKLYHSDPAELSPGQFSRSVIDAVERGGVRLVVIDSLSGYLNALPQGRHVVTLLHALMQHLARQGVLVIVILSQRGLLGEYARTEIESSYLADSVILLRQYPAGSEIRRSIAVMKKRHTDHDRQIRKLVIADGKIEVRGPVEDVPTSPDSSRWHSGA